MKARKSSPSFVLVGIGLGEETIVQTHFHGRGMGCRNPVQSRFDLASVGGPAAASLGIVGAAQFFDFARVRVLHHAHAFDEIGIPQADFAPGGQAIELWTAALP